MTFRTLDRQERTLLNRALDRWGAFDALKDAAFLTDGKRVCLVSKELAGIVAKVQPDECGLVMGKLGKQFSLSLAGAGLLARLSNQRKYRVSVSDNAEQLVLYGRDVMGESVIEAPQDLGENETVIITNRNGEAIGIGRTRFSVKLLSQKGRVTITTLVDAGSYLRDEGAEGQSKLAEKPSSSRSRRS
jgi:60S ribosome subunit biogenesis protein NIP7